jgi:hypothetical protein
MTPPKRLQLHNYFASCCRHVAKLLYQDECRLCAEVLNGWNWPIGAVRTFCDASYSPDFQDIAKRFAERQPDHGFDLVLIPIGAYAPRWFMKDQHVDPVEGVQIHKDLRARQSVAYHWGTFSLSDEALDAPDAPPAALAAARQGHGLSESAFAAISVGRTLRLPLRTAH